MLNKAAARLSHAIKNPLTGISGALQILEERLGPDSEHQELLARIEEEVERINLAVGELATFALVPAPILRPVNLHNVIEAALTRERAAHPKSYVISRDYDIELPPTLADEKLLTQAFSRLFKNALQAMPQGGTLSISTDRSGELLKVIIRDSGSGIDATALEKIFEPFYSAKTRGLGLGLAITQKLVQAHGGAVSADTLPGEGAEVVVTLPTT